MFIFSWFLFVQIYAQMGVGTTNPNTAALLEVNSTSKGVLIPRMSSAQMNAIASPAEGLMVYNTDVKSVKIYNGTQWCSSENQTSGFVDELDTLQFDNIRVRISNNRSATSIQLATVSGSVSVVGNSINLQRTSSGSGAANISTYIWQSKTLTTTFTHFQSNLDFNVEGSTQIIDIMDETNNKFYSIGFIFSDTYSNNFVYIKRKI